MELSVPPGIGREDNRESGTARAAETAAHDMRARCARYLELLPLSPQRRHELLAKACAGARDTREAMTALHLALAGASGPAECPACLSVPARLEAAYGDLQHDGGVEAMKD